MSSKTFTVTVSSSQNVNVAATYTTICKGFSTDTLIATGGTNYVWTSSPVTVPPLPPNDTIIVSPDQTTIYTVTVSNGSGCTGTATYTVNVTPGFNPPVVSPQNSSYCIGDSILPFTATPTSPAGIVWADGQGNFLLFGNSYQPLQNTPVGTYTFICAQGTSSQCLSYATIVTLTIHSVPTADAGSDISICAGHTANLNATGGTNYLWSPPTYLNNTTDANPSSTPDSTISYQVIVADANNCRDLDSVTVYAMISDTCGIHIFNVLTPNGDGDNDIFWIDGIIFFPDNTVEIFNRWGNSVWKGKNYDNKKVVWRGQNMNNQPLPAGTYYYVIDIKGRGRFSKWVELMR